MCEKNKEINEIKENDLNDVSGGSLPFIVFSSGDFSTPTLDKTEQSSSDVTSSNIVGYSSPEIPEK